MTVPLASEQAVEESLLREIQSEMDLGQRSGEDQDHGHGQANHGQAERGEETDDGIDHGLDSTDFTKVSNASSSPATKSGGPVIL